MNRFVQLRKNGRPTAWRQLQEDISSQAHVLTIPFNPMYPPTISPKDLLALLMDIEGFLKGVNEHVGRTSEENLREYLETGKIGGKELDIRM